MPTENPDKKNPHAKKEHGPSPEQKGYSTSEAVVSLRDALINEANTNREQNETRKTGPNWIEILTIALLLFTTIGVAIQDVILHSSDTTFKDTLAAQVISSQRQLRAYVGIVVPKEVGPNNFLPPSTPIIIVNIKNTGQTPAHNTVYEAALDIRSYPLPKNNDYTIKRSPFPSNPMTVFPGGIEPFTMKIPAPRALTVNEVARIQTGKTERLYVWGTINYQDIFDIGHYTNFCLSFFNPTEKDVQDEPCNDHNDSN